MDAFNDLQMDCTLFSDWFYCEPVVSESALPLSLHEIQEAYSSLNEFVDVPYLDPADVCFSDSIPSLVQCPLNSKPSGGEMNIDLTFWDDNFPSYYENGTLRSTAESLPLDIPPLAAIHFDEFERKEKGDGSSAGDLSQVTIKSAEAKYGSPSWGGDGHERSMEGRLRPSSIDFEEISRYFYVPITQAAKEMKVGLTVLKKRCRELGISRWPHRKMKSLNSLIHNVQELKRSDGERGEITLRREEIERLEAHKRLMEQRPEIQLTEETKKLRQACFKANYKKRRLMALTASQ